MTAESERDGRDEMDGGEEDESGTRVSVAASRAAEKAEILPDEDLAWGSGGKIQRWTGSRAKTPETRVRGSGPG